VFSRRAKPVAGAVAGAAAAVCCLALVPACSSDAQAGTVAVTRLTCEQRLDRTHGVPTLVVVGASFTAGVGPGNPAGSWAVLLARLLHWNAVVYGVPGAGYVRRGTDREGPVAAELARIDLHSLKPALVIIQAGHDDIGVPVLREERQVEKAVDAIRAEAPTARIALLTVFTGSTRRHSATHSAGGSANQTDHAIVTAGTAADRNVIIMDPLAGGWLFARAPGGLHPTAAGSEWIADKVAGILHARGVPAGDSAGPGSPLVLCDTGIGVTGPGVTAGKRKHITVPPPATLSARIVPPWLSATWRTMDSPSPEPGMPLADDAR